MAIIYFKKPKYELFPFVGDKCVLLFPLGTKNLIEWQLDQHKINKNKIEAIILDKDFFKKYLEEINILAEELQIKIEFVSKVDKRIVSSIDGYEIKLNNDKLILEYPWDFLKLNETIIKTIQPKNEGKIENFVTIKGDVVIGENVLVRSGSYIEGPVIIGDNSIVGPNCYLRSGTNLGRNTYAGNAVEIKNSIILDGTHVGHLSYVGDSIIGEKCNFGAGTLIANLKFDNSNVRMRINDEKIDTGRRKLGVIMADRTKTSINLSIMPGTYIKEGSRLITKDKIN